MKTFLYSSCFLVFFASLTNCESKTEDDCSNMTGATFLSNGGQMMSILQQKCGNSTCHGQGGEGSIHWEYSGDYADMQIHFEHLYEGAIEEDEMPPDTAVALTTEEISLFKCWKMAGFPE